MKLFLVLCLTVGLAAASLHHRILESQSQRVVDSFEKGLDNAGSLKDYLGLEKSDVAEVVDRIEKDIKRSIVDRLKEKLSELLEKLKESVEQGKEIPKNLLEKVKAIGDKLKELGGDFGTKVKELKETLLEKLKDKRQDLKDLLNKLLGRDKRDLGGVIDKIRENLKIKELLKDLKEKINEGKMKVQELIDYIRDRFDVSATIRKIGEDIIKQLESLGLDNVREYLNKLLNLLGGNRENSEKPHERSARALTDIVERLKELVGLGKDRLKNKLEKITDWTKNVFQSGVKNAENNLDVLEKIIEGIKDNFDKWYKKEISKAMQTS